MVQRLRRYIASEIWPEDRRRLTAFVKGFMVVAAAYPAAFLLNAIPYVGPVIAAAFIVIAIIAYASLITLPIVMVLICITQGPREREWLILGMLMAAYLIIAFTANSSTL